MRAVGVLGINVKRNPNPPIFTENPYFVKISEDEFRGNQIVVVTATDADGVSIITYFQFISFSTSVADLIRRWAYLTVISHCLEFEFEGSMNMLILWMDEGSFCLCLSMFFSFITLN